MSLSPALFALVSYAQLSTATTCVFSEWIWGLGGVVRKPGARHADLSPPPEQGTTLPEGDASRGSARPPASGRRSGPFFSLHSPLCVGPAERPPPAPPPPSPPQPSTETRPSGAAGAPSNRRPRRAPRAQLLSLRLSDPNPQSQLRETNPGAARKGKSGRRWRSGGQSRGSCPCPLRLPNR